LRPSQSKKGGYPQVFCRLCDIFGEWQVRRTKTEAAPSPKRPFGESAGSPGFSAAPCEQPDIRRANDIGNRRKG
jgi:hypothetical protein